MKEKNAKKKTYDEELLWAIIIILMMFITTLDVIWFGRKGQVAENQIEYNASYAILRTITVNNNGGTGGTSTVEICNSTTAPHYFFNIDGKLQTNGAKFTAPSRTGSTFIGYVDQDGNLICDKDGKIYTSFYPNSNSIANVTEINAKWNKTNDKYQFITLNKNGGTGGNDCIYVEDGTAYSDPMFTTELEKIYTPTRSGYVFSGYGYKSASGQAFVYADGTIYKAAIRGTYNGTKDDYTLYAIWSKKVTFNNDGGTGGPSSLYLKGSTLYSDADLTKEVTSITKPTKNGYTFKGYYTNYNNTDVVIINEDGTVNTNNTNIFSSTSASTTLIAKWEKTGIDKRTLDKNGGTGGTSEFYFWKGGIYSDSAATKEITSITIPSKTGYTFEGYYVTYGNTNVLVFDKNGAKTKDIGAVSVYTTIKARWTAITYTVAYNGNGATGGSTANSSHTYDVAKALTVNGYERKYTITYNHNYTGSNDISKTETYTFNGWATSASGAKVYNNSQSVTNLSSTNGATVTLYANWTISLYTPTRTGYIFGGWYKEAACTNKVTSPSSNTTLYAKWTPITYTVAYNGNGATGGSTANSSHTYDKAENLTANGYKKEYSITYNYNYTNGGSKDGTATYSFNGWATSASGTKEYNDKQSVKNLSSTNGATVTLYAKWSMGSLETPTRTGYIFEGWYKEAACTNRITAPTANNTTLYAKWTPITYTVTYNGNGATGGSTENSGHTYDVEKDLTANKYERKYTVTYNHNYTGSANTSKTATYTFNGWATSASGAKVYNNSQSVTNLSSTNGATVTLYANWSSASVSYTPSRTGYIFGGWYKEAACTNKVLDTYTPTSDITLYAKWTANTYTVTYNYNNATGGKGDNSKIVTYDSKYGTLPSPIRSYLISFNSKGGSNCNAQTATWDFGGWYSGNTNITADTTVTTASNHTLNASWSGGTISLPAPTRTGYTFAGWYSDEQYKNKVDNNTAYTAITTLYANWTANTYTITYNKNKPETASESVTGSTNDSSHTYDTSKVLTSNGYALKGWTFTGWNTAANGSGNSYGDGASVSNLSTKNGDTVTLYAQWKANTYTIKYNSNKPSGALTNVTGETKSSSHTCDVSKTLTSNGYALTGWTFKGWNTNDSGTGTSYENGASVSNLSSINGATVNLYAKWEANKYTVTYNYNNATGGNSVANKIVTYNSAYKELPTPTRSYTISFNSNQGTACTNQIATWNFENWFKESNFTTPVTADTIVSTADNHTIYAKWSNGKITLPTPTRTGYIFRGWYSDSEFKNQVSNTTQYNSNTTLYAKWEAIKYTVTYNSNKPETASSSVTGSTGDSTHTYDIERSLTKNGYALTGWTFTGWNTAANGNGTSYADEAKVVNQTATNGGRITLYAQWRANTYTVTYNKNNATEFDGETSKVVTYDSQYGSLPNVKREYTVVFAPNGGTDCAQKVSRYTFEGWHLGENRITSTDYVRTAKDHQLTAKWSGGEIELPTTIKEGAIFIGWYNENGEKVGEAGEKYAPTSDETLFAHYIGKEYTLTVNPNGGQWKDNTGKQNIVGRMDDTIVLDNPVAPDGYKVVFVKNNGLEDETVTQTRTFLGWELNTVGSLNGNQYTYGAGNSEVIAQYSTNDAIKLPTTEKQGYTFAGWYSDSALNTKVGNAGDSYIPKANTMLYAKWLPNTNTEYKIEYYTEKLDGSYELNNTATFTGTTDSNVIVEIKEIAGFEFNSDNSSNIKEGRVKPDGSLTLKLYYTRKTYTVTLNINEGNALENNTKQIKYEAEYGELPEPTKEGHTFIGWYDSKVDGNQIKTTTKQEKTEDHTLYAHWKVNTYTLTINPNGGEYNGNPVSSTYTQDYNSTKEIENPTKNKDGYKVTFVNIGGEAVDPIVQTSTFTSWSLEGAGKLEKVNGKTVYTYGAKDTVITANYTENNIVLPNATKVGYSLKGWKTINDIKVGEAGDEYLPTSDITLYAIYEENFYDLKIDPNGGKWNGSSEVQTVTGKYGSSYVIADPEAPQGYTVKLHYNNENNDTKEITQTQEFDGWENDNGYGTLIGKTYKYGAGIDTLKAKYSRNTLQLPTPTRTGYTFQGWYSDEACKEKFGDAGYTYNPTEDGELYAKWAANTYTITFNVNDGDNLENNTKDVVYAEKYGELPIPTRAGYTFIGWFNSVSKEITADSIVDITENIVLTAKWTESELTITFDVYKGQVEPTSKKVIYKQEYGTLPIPTMEGCEFEGWYDSQEQLANKVIDTSIVRKTEDHTLYAKWKDIQGPKFTYDINNIYTIEVHSEIPEFKVTATDNYDDDVDITVTNNIQKDVVGIYEYIITATDKAGNTTTETKEFKVVDTTAPEISIKDDVNVYEMEVHGEKPTFLATATDNYDEHVDVVVTDDIDIHTVGTYKITFTATDTNGNVQTDTRSFEVKDTTPPVIAVDDENNKYTMEVHGEKPTFVVTATDNYDEHVDVEITDDIDVHKVGTYTITFKAKDTNNNSTTTTRSFKVVDTTPPVITVDDEKNTYTMEVHGTKPAFLATAIDNYDGEIGVEITDDINVDVVGTYTVTFKSTDTNGNVATETREFKVVDTTPPVITVDDENNKNTMEVHGEKPAFVATAIDNYDEHVDVVVTDDINVDVVGTYTVTFTSTDTNGNVATETREFKVIDTTPPVITVDDENNKYEMEVHGEKPTFVATATDNYDEHVDVVVTDDINVDVVGTYTVTFTSTDTNGNVATETREFKVVDTTPPVITVDDENNKYTMEVHGEKPTFVATATDNYDEHVEVVVTDDINVDVVGTYTVTFTSTDINGNVATETREFKVVDTTPPVITVDDENNKYTMEVHGEKPTFVATVTDNYDEHVDVVVTDDINVDVVGTYTVTFTSTDTNGNVATETREFKVIDTTAPVITVDDENNKYEMRVFEEIPTFTATATDNYDEEVTVKITNTIDRTNVGTYTVTFTATDKAGNEAKVEREFKVLKTKPEYEIPTGIEARYIDTLADVKLPEGFTFEDDLSTSVGPEGENTFKVTFTPKDLHNYEIVTGIEILIKVNYLNVDTNGDGKADLNVDTDGDGKADLNVDTDRNGKADLNVDTDGDGKADLNVDTDGDGKADLNVDIDGDGKPDLNIDTDGDGKPDKNLQKDEDKSDDPTNNEDSDIIYSNEDYSGSNTYTKGNLRIYSEKYIFGNKYMEYVKNKNTVKALKSWCTSNGTIEVYDKGGMLKMKDTDYVGTGMILEVTKDEESMSFIIVVQGDTSGDGIVTTADAAQVEFHILNKKVLEGAAFRAADINRNKAVTGEDLATITRSLQYLEAESVNPNYVEEVEETTEEPKDTAETTDEETEDTAKKEENNTNSTINKDTIKENTNTTNNTKKEDTKDNKDKENTNKTDTTKDNKVNETEEKENNTENKTTEKTEDTSSEKVNLPENDTVQYKKQEE